MSRIHHTPYVPANESMAEFTFRAVLLGVIFGLIFGATTSYLALKVGLTVSASIPIAVLAISLFKRFGGSTILENNIVQTVGSSGESVAAAVAFTLPALLFLGSGKEYFNYMQIFVLALSGGILGVLLMVPLRKNLIVQEHGRLPFPEGTACADILIAGEKGGNLAKKVYEGIAIGVVYKVLMSIFGLWKEIPQYVFSKKSVLPNGIVAAEITPELVGVGYIIGIRGSGTLVAGGILSALILTPLISYFGDYVTVVIPPASKLISEMTPMEIWSKYIRYIGAGAVTLAGIFTMIRTFPTIVSTVSQTMKSLRRKEETGIEQNVPRTERDLSWSYVIGGTIALLIAMVVIPTIPVTWVSAILIFVAGAIFVTVSSRVVGLIGVSSNPISGMTIATLMATSLIFISQGWTQDIYQPMALCVGAIVAMAAAIGGTTSQDLKTGFLVGATPVKQQIGMIIGVAASSIAVGYTIILLSNTIGIGEITPEHAAPLPAPQATLMATIIKGLLDQSLPWNLVFIGMGIALVVELLGVSTLAFAVGTYLPLSTTAPIFVGGLIKWFVRRKKQIKAEEAEMESGALFSSGLIAGGALTGIVVAVLLGTSMGTTAEGKTISLMDMVNTHIGDNLAHADLVGLIAFVILGALLYLFSIKKID